MRELEGAKPDSKGIKRLVKGSGARQAMSEAKTFPSREMGM